MSYPFIEYLSYKLKSYGKKGYPYLQILEEQVEKKGSSVSDTIKKEHFDMAVKKVLMGNLILSLKEISKIDFLEIFEELGGVEEILKKDPAGIYEKMDYNSKNMYRAKINEIASRAKVSEIYVAKILLEMAEKEDDERKRHIGYFLLEDVNTLYERLEVNIRKLEPEKKAKLYVITNLIYPLFLSFIIFIATYVYSNSFLYSFFICLISYIPLTEITIQSINYILRKMCKTY